jgi:predicted dehydrogenase
MPDTYRHLFKKFYASIENGRLDDDLASFKDGLREMELCEKVIRSAAERRWMTLD